MQDFNQKIVFILQSENVSLIISLMTIGTAMATFMALAFSIYQSILSRRSLDAAKLAISEDIKARQLLMIPDMHYVILVQLSLERWKKELVGFKEKTKKAVINRDAKILKKISAEAPTSPNAVMVYVDAYTYEKMPDSLRAIVISGAQHFYNVAGTVRAMCENETIQWAWASSMESRFNESISAIDELYDLINQMIPSVLLETPQSIQNSQFLK